MAGPVFIWILTEQAVNGYSCRFLSPPSLQTIYRNVLDDVYEYPILEKELKEFQKILGMHRRQYVAFLVAVNECKSQCENLGCCVCKVNDFYILTLDLSWLPNISSSKLCVFTFVNKNRTLVILTDFCFP